MELFDRIDRIQYKGYTLTNILRRVVPIRRILNRIDVYYDYIIKDGERADTIAYDYYGDSSYAWLVYISNNIYDPYYQWPLDHYQFINFMNVKYGDYTTTFSQIHHYSNPEKDYTVSPTTFNYWTIEQRFGWSPVSVYDWEYDKNEKKRQIKLISNRYISQINQQVSELFK